MNILLVEDSALVARALIRQIQPRGHIVIHVNGIAEATEALSVGVFDVVVTDRDVEDGDAWVWARNIPIRVVYMSGRPDIDHPFEYFTKGDATSKLIHMIEGVQ